MASITPRKNKAGQITSYRIRVSRGRGLKPFEMTWPERGEPIPETWSNERVQKQLTKVAALFEHQCETGTVPIEKITFAAYAEIVLKNKEFAGTKTRTIESYKYLLQRINDKEIGIGHLRLDEIRPTHLNAFYQKLAEPGMNNKNGKRGKSLSAKTRLEYHRLCHNILAQAVKESLLPFNPADRATPPKVQRKEAEHLEIEQVHEIMDALETEDLKWRALVNFLLASGCRRGEALGLRWKDVNFENNTVYICNTVLYSPKKGAYESTTKTGENREITICVEALDILRKWKKEQTIRRLKVGPLWTEQGFVFTQDNGDPMHPDSVTNWFTKFSDRHGLPHLHPHTLRHTQASMLIAKGVDIVTVSKRLGHSKVDTTLNVYSHVMKNADQEAANVLDGVIYRKA